MFFFSAQLLSTCDSFPVQPLAVGCNCMPFYFVESFTSFPMHFPRTRAFWSFTDHHRNRIHTVKWNKQILFSYIRQILPSGVWWNSLTWHLPKSACIHISIPFVSVWTCLDHCVFPVFIAFNKKPTYWLRYHGLNVNGLCFSCVKRVQSFFFGNYHRFRNSQGRSFHPVTFGKHSEYTVWMDQLMRTWLNSNWTEFEILNFTPKLNFVKGGGPGFNPHWGQFLTNFFLLFTV